MKMLKKIILILAALCLVLCLVACDSDKGTTGDDNTDAKTDKNVGVSYFVNYNGTKITLGGAADATISALGTPQSKSELGNCGGLGSQVKYTYTSMYVYVLEKYNNVAGKNFDVESVREGIRKHLFDAERGLYKIADDRTLVGQLGNALAVLCGAAAGKIAEDICEKAIADAEMTPVSVSMQCFLFDALLQVDRIKYAPYILERIEQTYRPMVERGIGTVWETERGEADFGNAGSLCHGWSAMPIYYYHLLK